MTSQERINAIKNSPETGEMKSVKYGTGVQILPVKNIPLKYLLYNPHNGRIRSYTKSYEAQFHRLNPEDENDKLIIEQYLFDSASNKNSKTLDSLALNGQQEVGIVTKDGVIIDGNRRAMLLNILSKRNVELGNFKAIVLPDSLAENEEEIVKLETSYQMGVDSKVDYNPIEKYIRCQELQSIYKLDVAAIAAIMAESKKKIEDWLNILELMDEYLEYLDTPKVYPRLEKREGHFVDLSTYLKSYSAQNSNVNWQYKPEDLTNLKHAYFDYVRLGIPVLRARVIGRLSESNSFFCHRNIWEDFFVDHKQILSSYQDLNFQEVKEDNPDKSIEDIIRNIDQLWKENLQNKLEENLAYSEGVLKDTLEVHAPVKILKRVLNSLGQVKKDKILTTDHAEITALVNLIDKRLNNIKDIIRTEH